MNVDFGSRQKLLEFVGLDEARKIGMVVIRRVAWHRGDDAIAGLRFWCSAGGRVLLFE